MRRKGMERVTCACGSDGSGDDRLCEQRNVRYNH